MGLSTEDQRLIEELYREGVLHERMFDTNLSRTCVVTDAEYPSPRISADIETPAMFTFANIGGALMLASGADDEIRESARRFLTWQIKQVLPGCTSLAFVACAPSLHMYEIDMTLVRAMSLLVTLCQVWQVGSAHHREVHGFLIIHFSDGRKFTYQVDPDRFKVWHKKYEQRPIGVEDEFGDDDQDDDPL